MQLRWVMELLTRKQAAERLTLSISEVDRLCASGELQKIPLGLRAVRISGASIDAFLERRCNRGVLGGDALASNKGDAAWIDPADPLRARREARGRAREQQQQRTLTQEPVRG